MYLGTKDVRSSFAGTTRLYMYIHVVDALIVTDSRLVIRVENMVTTSSLEDLEVDLNGAMSNCLRLALLVLHVLSSLLSSSDYVDLINVYVYVENCYVYIQD